jgi:hypothetical protein
MLEDGAVVRLASADKHHQRPSGTVDEMMDFAGQTTA